MDNPSHDHARQSRITPHQSAVSRDDVSQEDLIGLGRSSIRKNYYAELKRSLSELQRFRDLLDRSNDGVFLIGFPDLLILDCNQAAAYLLEKENGCVGGCTMLTDVLQPDELNGLAAFCEQSKVEDSYTWVVHFRRSTTTPVTAEVTLRRVQYDEREFLVGTAHDITERELLTEQLRNSLREKDVMLREIHHRVGNNYQLINSLLALELSFSGSSTAADVAVSTDSLGHRLVRNTIDRVQSMAAIHADLYRANDFQRVAMLPLTQSLLHRVIASRVQTTRDIEVTVTGSPIELDMGTAVPVSLLLNELTTNAIEHVYRKQGAMTVTVSWEQEGEKVLLCFHDDGLGMPAHIDIHNPKTLGLSLIANLARQAHAELSYTFKQGAEFQLRFPYKL